METNSAKLTVDRAAENVDATFLKAFDDVDMYAKKLYENDASRKFGKSERTVLYKCALNFLTRIRNCWNATKKMKFRRQAGKEGTEEDTKHIYWAEVFYRRFRAARKPIATDLLDFVRLLLVEAERRGGKGQLKNLIAIARLGIQYINSHKVDVDNSLIGLSPSDMVMKAIVPFESTSSDGNDGEGIIHSNRVPMGLAVFETEISNRATVSSSISGAKSPRKLKSRSAKSKTTGGPAASVASMARASANEPSSNQSPHLSSSSSKGHARKPSGSGGLLAGLLRSSKSKRENVLPIPPPPDRMELARLHTQKYLVNTLIELSFLEDHRAVSKQLVELSTLLQLAHGSPTRSQLRAGSIVLVKLNSDQQRKALPLMNQKKTTNMEEEVDNEEKISNNARERVYFARVITPPPTSSDLFLRSRARTASANSGNMPGLSANQGDQQGHREPSTILVSLDPFESDPHVKFLVDTDCIRSLPEDIVSLCHNFRCRSSLVHYPLRSVYERVSSRLVAKIHEQLVSGDIPANILKKLLAKKLFEVSEFSFLQQVVDTLHRGSAISDDVLQDIVTDTQLYLDAQVDEIQFCRLYFPLREDGFNELYKYRRQLGKMAQWQIDSLLSTCEAHVDRMQSQLRKVIDGKRKQELEKWWNETIGKQLITFLEAHGFIRRVLGDLHGQVAGTDLRHLRTNQKLINKLLDPHSCLEYEIVAFVEMVRSLVYVEVDKFIHDATLVLRLELHVSGASSLENENHSAAMITEIQDAQKTLVEVKNENKKSHPVASDTPSNSAGKSGPQKSASQPSMSKHLQKSHPQEESKHDSINLVEAMDEPSSDSLVPQNANWKKLMVSPKELEILRTSLMEMKPNLDECTFHYLSETLNDLQSLISMKRCDMKTHFMEFAKKFGRAGFVVLGQQELSVVRLLLKHILEIQFEVDSLLAVWDNEEISEEDKSKANAQSSKVYRVSQSMSATNYSSLRHAVKSMGAHGFREYSEPNLLQSPWLANYRREQRMKKSKLRSNSHDSPEISSAATISATSQRLSSKSFTSISSTQGLGAEKTVLKKGWSSSGQDALEEDAKSDRSNGTSSKSSSKPTARLFGSGLSFLRIGKTSTSRTEVGDLSGLSNLTPLRLVLEEIEQIPSFQLQAEIELQKTADIVTTTIDEISSSAAKEENDGEGENRPRASRIAGLSILRKRHGGSLLSIRSSSEKSVKSLGVQSASASSKRNVTRESSRLSILQWQRDTNHSLRRRLSLVANKFELLRLVQQDERIFLLQLKLLFTGLLEPLLSAKDLPDDVLPPSFASGCAHLQSLIELHSQLDALLTSSLRSATQAHHVNPQEKTQELEKTEAVDQMDQRKTEKSVENASVPLKTDLVAAIEMVGVYTLQQRHRAYRIWYTESKIQDRFPGHNKKLRDYIQPRIELVQQKSSSCTLAYLFRSPLHRLALLADVVTAHDGLFTDQVELEDPSLEEKMDS